MDPIQLSSEKKGPGSDGQAPSPEKAKAIVDVSQDPTEKTVCAPGNRLGRPLESDKTTVHIQ